MQMAGETGGHNPSIAVFLEQRAKHAANGCFARGVTRFFGVRRVAQHDSHAIACGQLAEPGEIGVTPVDRCEIELPVAGVDDRALHGV